MLEISPHLFVALILSCVWVGVGVCLLIVLPIARSMRKTNAEYQNQVGVQGVIWEEIFDRQQNECDRYHRIACDMEKRFWVAVRMSYGDRKGPGAALADRLCDAPSTPLPNGSPRPSRRGARTGSEEVQVARRNRQDRMISRGVGVPESTDGTNPK